jgi:putative ABC transport system permease protein
MNIVLIRSIRIITPDNHQEIWIKTTNNNISKAIPVIKNVYSNLTDDPFVYEILEISNENLYKQERNRRNLKSIVATLVFMISCFGIFSFVALYIEQRLKEIGIRKIFGASNLNIIQFCIRDLISICLISIAVGLPVGYFIIQHWLQHYAFRISIQWNIMVIPILTIVTLCLLTIYANTRVALRKKIVLLLRKD